MAITYEVRDITPELAQKWLDTANTHNRNLRPLRVADYARDMRTGMWVENGDALRFAEDGTLLDGQHRLAAVVESRVTVPMLVVSGLAPAAQDTVDDGVRRTLQDVLQLRGEHNATALGAVLRRAFLWEGYPDRSPRGYAKVRPTNAEALDMLKRHPELRVAAAEASRLYSGGVPIPKSALGLMHWLAYRIDESDAAEFFARLQMGDGLTRYDAIFQLRKRAFQMRSATGRESDHVYFALLAKAWNLYRDGTPVEILSYRGGGAAPERFPEPR